MAKEILEFELKAETSEAKKEVKRFEDDIDGFRKRIQDKKAIEFSVNVAKIKSQIDNIKQQLKEVEDEDVKIELTANLERLGQQLTRAKAELRNYARVGDANISVLGKLFQGVTQDIEKSRLELIKLWKTTDGLDRIEAELNQVNKQFAEGKISIQEYGSKLNSLQGNINNTEGVFNKLKGTLQATAGFFIAGLGFAEVVDFAKESVLAFAKFENGLARINTVANVTKEEMSLLGNEIKNISVQFGIAKDELLETGFNISSAGVEFQNVASILKLASITAIWSGTDTTTAFNGIIAVLKKYGENLNEAWNIAEKFFIANKLGQTTIEDMATAIQNLTSSVKPAGVQINEVFAILSTLTGVTWDANAVITQLNGAINALASPTTEASKLFKQLGIEVGQDAIAQKGFVTVAKEVYDATGGNLEILRKLIPEIEASKLIVALATTQNEKYKIALDEVTTWNGNLEEAVKKMADTTQFKLNVATKKWDSFKTSTGNVLVTIGGFLIDFGNVIVSVFKIFWNFIKQWVNVFLGFSDVIISWLVDLVQNWEEFARVIPLYVKKALNDLPQIASIWLRKFLAVFGDLGKTISDKLGLQESITKVFEDVDTNFNFKNTNRAFSNLVNNAVANNEAIAKEWTNITSIIEGKSKEQQLAIKETLDEVKNLKQNFWSTGDTIDDTTDSMDNLNNSLSWTTKKTKEQTEAEKEAKKILEEKKKQIEELGKTNKQVYGGIIKDITDTITNMEKYVDEIEKVNNKIQDFKNEATSNIRDINNELSELWKKGTEDVGDRFIKIGEEIQATKDKLQDLKDKGISLNLAESIGLETLQKIPKSSLFGDVSAGDLLEVLKIQTDLNNLLKEQKLAQENLTKEEIQQAEIRNNLNPIEKLLQEQEAEKQILEERRAIYEALANGEKINLDAIADYKNLKLAEELTAKQTALDIELKTLTNNLDEQRKLIIKINADKKKFEADWTKFFGTEIQKQKNYVIQLQTELLRVIQLQKEAGLQGIQIGKTVTAEQEAKIQNSVDNSKKVDININASNNVDIDYTLQKISETVK